jgi:uncharacterized phage protein gp47/JayE
MTTIDANGLTISTYEQRLIALQTGFQTIYGSDASVDPATPDGQLLALIAEAASSCDQALAELYATMDPDTASGNPLSRLGRLAGNTQRIAGSQTAVTVTCVGTIGASLVSPTVANSAGSQFNYSGTLTIGGGGTVSATFVSAALGAFDVTAQTAKIINPQFGWVSASITGGTLGVDYEKDPAFRIRRAKSTSQNAKALDDAMTAALLAIPGITDCLIYDNNGQATDANGITPHSIAIVLDGMDVGAGTVAAAVVWQKLAPGPTIQALAGALRPDGSASSVPYFVTDSKGTLRPIYLNQVAYNQPYIRIEGVKRAGWIDGTSPIAIADAIAVWGNENLRTNDSLYMDDLIPIVLAAVPGPTALSALGITSITWGSAPLSAPGSSSPIAGAAFVRTQLLYSRVSVVAT